MADQLLAEQTTAERLAALEMMTAKLLKIAMQEREPIDTTVYVSTSQPWVVDYRNRKHLYLFSAQSLVLSCQDVGQVVLPANTFYLLELPTGLRCTLVAPVGPVALLVHATDELLPEIALAQAIGVAATPLSTNPTQTAAAAADTAYSWTARVAHVSLQNNTTGNIFYAFDQSTTVAGNQVYVLASGQFASWDRQCSVLHMSSAASALFGGQAGITIEGFL